MSHLYFIDIPLIFHCIRKQKLPVFFQKVRGLAPRFRPWRGASTSASRSIRNRSSACPPPRASSPCRRQGDGISGRLWWKTSRVYIYILLLLLLLFWNFNHRLHVICIYTYKYTCRYRYVYAPCLYNKYPYFMAPIKVAGIQSSRFAIMNNRTVKSYRSTSLHCWSLLITGDYCWWLLITVDHWWSLMRSF